MTESVLLNLNEVSDKIVEMAKNKATMELIREEKNFTRLPSDRVIPLAKEIYNVGYEDGVKACNVGARIVWEERIEDIKKQILENSFCQSTYTDNPYSSILLIMVEKVIQIIDDSIKEVT